MNTPQIKPKTSTKLFRFKKLNQPRQNTKMNTFKLFSEIITGATTSKEFDVIDDLAESIITLFCKRESNLKNQPSLKIILNLLSKQLRKYEHFNNFLNYNRIDNFTLRNATKLFQYEQYPPGTQLFQQGEQSYKFWGIIKGTVSFKQTKHSHNIDSPVESMELFQYSNGRCFNEWNVLYDKKHQYSAITLTECHLFTLEKDLFKDTFGALLQKAENDRKTFIYKTLPILKQYIPHKVEEMVKHNVKPFFYKRNDTIYEQNECANALYLLYMGECALKIDKTQSAHEILSNLNQPVQSILKYLPEVDYIDFFNNELSQVNDATEKKHLKNTNQLSTVINLSSGDIGGLECVAGIAKTKYTMVAQSEFVAILKFEICNLYDYRNTICQSLIPLFINKEKIIKNNIDSKKVLNRQINKKITRKNKSLDELKKDKYSYLNNHWGNTIDTINKLTNKLETNNAGFVKISDKNKKIFFEKEFIEEQYIEHKSMSKEISLALNKPFRLKTPKKQLVKLLKKTNNIYLTKFNSSNETPKSMFSLLSNYKSNVDTNDNEPNNELSNKDLTLTSDRKVNNLAILKKESEEKRQAYLNQILEMFDRIIDHKLVKGTNALMKREKKRNEKKMALPDFADLKRMSRRNKSSEEMKKIDYKGNKFVEGNYRFNCFFNRDIKSAKAVRMFKENKDIKKGSDVIKYGTLYNSGSYEMPLAIDILLDGCYTYNRKSKGTQSFVSK